MSFWRQKTNPVDEVLCPDFKSPCIKHRCVAWQHVVGLDPQTGKEVDMFDCAKYNWDHKIQIQVAQKVNQVAACIESLRNEVVSTGIGAQAVVTNFLRYINENTIPSPGQRSLRPGSDARVLEPPVGRDTNGTELRISGSYTGGSDGQSSSSG